MRQKDADGTKVEPFRDEQAGRSTVRGFIHQPANSSGDTLILTHGAGGNCESPLLLALAEAFSTNGVTVLRCDLPFRQLRPKGRPLGQWATCDQAGLRRAVDVFKARTSAKVYLGGHSYGGHQASILAASEPSLVDGLLLLSYPLHPPQQPTQLRTSHFPALRTRSLFIQSANDPFGTAQELRAALALSPAQTKLMVVKNARHELLTEKNSQELPLLISREFNVLFDQSDHK
jgi:predicted alpha/beta-hydrolase family hydrolase